MGEGADRVRGRKVTLRSTAHSRESGNPVYYREPLVPAGVHPRESGGGDERREVQESRPMAPVLALYEDVLSDGAALALPAAARMIFLVHGAATITGRALRAGEAWHGEGAAALVAASTGATCWRFDFASPPAATPPGVTSREKLSAPLATLPAGELLLRGDSVAFPPGGCGLPHPPQGPGIRCLVEG